MATRTNLSIRNATAAKTGLQDMCNFIIKAIGVDVVLLEVGAFSGDSASIFADNFRSIYSVDPWESNYDPTGADHASNPALYNMVEVEAAFDIVSKRYGNITKLKMLSSQAVHQFEDGIIDVVYLDGNHNYDSVKADILLWKAKPSHFLGFHDYSSKHYLGVKKAINELLGEPLALFSDSSCIFNKEQYN